MRKTKTKAAKLPAVTLNGNGDLDGLDVVVGHFKGKSARAVGFIGERLYFFDDGNLTRLGLADAARAAADLYRTGEEYELEYVGWLELAKADLLERLADAISKKTATRKKGVRA